MIPKFEQILDLIKNFTNDFFSVSMKQKAIYNGTSYNNYNSSNKIITIFSHKPYLLAYISTVGAVGIAPYRKANVVSSPKFILLMRDPLLEP